MKRQDISFVEKIGPHCQVKAEQPPLFLEEQIAPLLHKTTRSCRASKRRTIIEHETVFWKAAQLLPFSAANLVGFKLSDWFPRAPGVCWSRYGVKARRSLYGCHEENDPLLGTIYSPQGKLSLLSMAELGLSVFVRDLSMKFHATLHPPLQESSARAGFCWLFRWIYWQT